jgi:hypothetical protein
MFTCREELSKDQLKRIKKIIHLDDFKKINSIINICDLNQSEEDIIKNIKDYIWLLLANRRTSEFPHKVDNFISFIENYPNIKRPSFTFPSKDGKIHELSDDYLVVCNGYHIYHDYRYLNGRRVNGLYMQESYLGTDHKIYLSKKSMKSRTLPVSRETSMEVDYNSLLVESVFNYFSEPVASYYLVKTNAIPYNSIITPSFLESNQELIHLRDLDDEERENTIDTHSNRLNIIINSLTKRYKGIMNDNDFQNMINKVQLQYCIQSFMKLLVGPMDANYGNTGIILTHNENGIPSIEIAPAFDLDVSFNISTELMKSNNIDQIKDINGNPSTITSIIKEFKDIPGFKEFLDNFVKKLLNHNAPKNILNNVYERTNLSFFKEREDSYIHFLDKRFIEVLDAYRNTYIMEAINGVKMGR